MNSIPIVTVEDLATDSFTANKKGIDLKLSSASGNGLKLTPDGLIYSAAGGGASANPRVLLGAFAPGAFNTFNFNDEVDIDVRVESLGSDGDYLYFGLNSPHTLALSPHAHQDATTYGREIGGVVYGNSFNSISWQDQSIQQGVTYSVDGVTRTLMLSHVRLDTMFYVWCDVICIEPLNFVGLGSGNSGDGSLTFNGKTYSEIYVNASYNLDLVSIDAYNDAGGGSYDYYLAQIGSNGQVSPLFSFLNSDNQYPVIQEYNYWANLLVVLHNNGAILTVIDGERNSVDFNTGREEAHGAIDIYPDPDSTDMLIAVAYGDNDIVDIYRYNAHNRLITKDAEFGVNFTEYRQGSNYYFIMALKIISSTRFGFAMFLAMPNNQYASKMMVINTDASEVVAEQPMVDSSVYSGVENQKWLMDLDHDTSTVHVYELTETGINHILEHQLASPGYAVLVKAGDTTSGVGVDRLPGVVFNNWDNTDFTIITPYVNDEDVPTLHVQNATSEQPLDSYSDHLGYGELTLTSPSMITAIDKSLKAVAVSLTLVD